MEKKILSYGIIVSFYSIEEIRKSNYKFLNKIKYLVIQRKYSFAFVSIIRGEYDDFNELVLFSKHLTNDEINLLKSTPFEKLWNMTTISSNLSLYNIAKSKFQSIKKGKEFKNTNLFISLADILDFSPKIETLEWGFPKGKREKYDKSIKDTALREFKEETNLDPSKIVFSDFEFKEEIVGLNGIKYNYIYYYGIYDSDEIPKLEIINEFQQIETNNIEWMNLNKIRKKLPKERVKIIENIELSIKNSIRYDAGKNYPSIKNNIKLIETPIKNDKEIKTKKELIIICTSCGTKFSYNVEKN